MPFPFVWPHVEHARTLAPYARHAWESTGPGLLDDQRCAKCGRRSSTAPLTACPVVLEGPPVLVLGWVAGDPRALIYPGGATVAP